MNNHLSQSAVCPICNGEVFPRFSVPCDYRKPQIPKDYEIYWCSRCDYGFVWERPKKEEIADFYIMEDYYTHSAANDGNNHNKLSFLDRLRNNISWRLDASENLAPHEVQSLLQGEELTICEIGCGNGNNLSKFLTEGFSVFGVEPDSSARKVAQEQIINVFDGTAEELPKAISDRKYDVVLMSHVLEHCLDINAAVSNAKRILSKGGIYIVETPNCQSQGFKDYQGEWPWSDIPRHLNFFTPSSLEKILIKYGFDVKFTKYSGFCRQFSNSWLKEEEIIWLTFSKFISQKNSPPNFKARAWKLLLKSLFASKAFKYDSVRLVGVNAN